MTKSTCSHKEEEKKLKKADSQRSESRSKTHIRFKITLISITQYRMCTNVQGKKFSSSSSSTSSSSSSSSSSSLKKKKEAGKIVYLNVLNKFLFKPKDGTFLI